MSAISLREVTEADVEVFYGYQRDPVAVAMAAPVSPQIGISTRLSEIETTAAVPSERAHARW